MSVITGLFKEAYLLFSRMSPYLLFGFFFAGLLHIFFKPETIARHLGKSNFVSVIKAALFGIPLPLCSCSVIPTAMSLRKEGASRGSVLSFLISTPTTGIDSIFATYALLGGLFTIYRIIAAFITGTLAGILVNIFVKEEVSVKTEEKVVCKLCEAEDSHVHGLMDNVKGVFTYAFGSLVKDTGPALIIGIAIGAIIAYFLPMRIIETYMGTGIMAMLIMLIIGIPMYVCATASIPIAAALMLKGLSPGAAFVFLVAGPATNIVTMAVVAKNMGKKTLMIYLGSIAATSVFLGLALNEVYIHFYKIELSSFVPRCHEVVPGPIAMASSIILAFLILYNLERKNMFFLFKKLFGIIVTAVFVLGFAQVSFSQEAVQKSTEGFTTRQIYRFIYYYIASETRGTGTFNAYDPLVKGTRRLAVMKLAGQVFKAGDTYYSRGNCRDGDSGEFVDVDFNVKVDENGKLAVDSITIYAVGGVQRYKRDKSGSIIPLKK